MDDDYDDFQDGFGDQGDEMIFDAPIDNFGTENKIQTLDKNNLTIENEVPEMAVPDHMYKFETLPQCSEEDIKDIGLLPISLYNATAAFHLLENDKKINEDGQNTTEQTKSKLNLRKLAIKIKGCEFTPPGTNARLRTVSPSGVASIGPTGYVHLTGCTNLEKARECAGLIVAIVRAAGYPEAKCIDFRICTLLAAVRLPFGINLEKVASNLALSSYEPEVFPALQYRMILERPTGDNLPFNGPIKVNISIMSNGACNITGVNCIEQVRYCITKIYGLLKMHSIPLSEGQKEQVFSGNVLSTHARAYINRRLRLCRSGICTENGDEMNPEILEKMAENERMNAVNAELKQNTEAAITGNNNSAIIENNHKEITKQNIKLEAKEISTNYNINSKKIENKRNQRENELIIKNNNPISSDKNETNIRKQTKMIKEKKENPRKRNSRRYEPKLQLDD